MAKVLIVEDEADLCQVIAYGLRQSGHDPLCVGRGADALRIAQSEHLDLVLLDMVLPDIPGTEVCRALRGAHATRHVPVIILSARGDEIDRVVGFEVGADDYVVKPFSVREVMLRVNALLRRVSAPRPVEADPNSVFGCLEIDRDAHRLWVEGREVELTVLEFRLLLTLFGRKNRVQTRATLLDDVWGIRAGVTVRTVDTHVKRLREKLGAARNYVETVRGVGYRFRASPDPDG